MGDIYDSKFDKWFEEDYKGKPLDYDDDLIVFLNKQQVTIEQLQEENLYKNFELKSVDDLKKLKDIFETCMILIDGAIADEDLEMGYESVFQFERRIKKFDE